MKKKVTSTDIAHAAGVSQSTVSMIYGSGMRNISAGAVIAGAYFPAEVLFPVMIGTLFQQILAAFYGSRRSGKREKEQNGRSFLLYSAQT